MLDWPQFLRSHRIDFVEHGPSTSKGNLYVDCPYCGPTFKGYPLLGISLKGRGWGCWRNKNHRGKSPVRLVAALLNISITRAAELLNLRSAPLESDDTIGDRVREMVNGKPEASATQATVLTLPKEFKPIRADRQGQIFLDYLKNERHYATDQALSISARYDLRFAMKGPFAYRIIMPIYDREERLVTWTGRTISPIKEPRYKTLSTKSDDEDNDQPLALSPITDHIFKEPDLPESGDLLLVTEGPFDAIRLDYAGSFLKRRTVAATCIFGKVIHDSQIDKLADLDYRRKLLLLDSDAKLDSYRVIEALRPLGFQTATIPERYKDADQMSLSAAQRFIIRELERSFH